MRRLAQPKVVAASATAAALSAALCVPRLLLWANRPLPLWYVEATIFFGSFVLWAFVFAWHTEYTRRPVFTLKINPKLFAGATLAAIFAALVSYLTMDPTLRLVVPEDYPVDFPHWIATTLFALVFTQLFLVFAPVAWSMRLFRNEKIALWLTVFLGLFVMVLRTRTFARPIPNALFIEQFASRIVMGYFVVWFYLRGGILLVWWLSLIIEARLLIEIFAS